MNNLFKNEFKGLNKNAIINIVNGCAGQEILTSNSALTVPKCFIKYIEDDSYGFWDIEWGWKSVKCNNVLPSGFFQFRIKLTPFKVEFENTNSSFNPFKTNNKKQLQDYWYILIHKNCQHYKHAIIDETNKFINKLELFNNTDNNKDKD